MRVELYCLHFKQKLTLRPTQRTQQCQHTTHRGGTNVLGNFLSKGEDPSPQNHPGMCEKGKGTS